MPSTTEQRFLSGSYAAVRDETTVVDLAVDTSLPVVPSGRYSRIGPNPAGNRRRPYKWSTGDGMLHPSTPWPPYASIEASPLASTAPGSAGRSER